MLVLIHLALTFGMLSLLAVGGGTAVLHEMQEVLQQTYKITADTFVHVYSVGQLAPGPNMTMVLIFGFQIAGAFGAAIVGLSFFLPSSFLCFWIGRIWNRIGDTPWRRSVQSALEPISIGLMCSGVYAVAKAALVGPVTIALAATSLVIILFTRVNPVYVILGLGGAGAGINYWLSLPS
ncbi:MAG: chromate transporter [Burkholderiaceae bacterium]|nr:chromate transporter [Burkholderiaceae bacterium]MCD8564756.1 chromate transporter [Burkholderiaceae bacterium]